jgi:hypothetical protein
MMLRWYWDDAVIPRWYCDAGGFKPALSPLVETDSKCSKYRKTKFFNFYRISGDWNLQWFLVLTAAARLECLVVSGSGLEILNFFDPSAAAAGFCQKKSAAAAAKPYGLHL